MKVKTEYQYIYFKIRPKIPNRKTDLWDCYNKHHHSYLGHIAWYGPWRQYIFSPEDDTLFSRGCLNDIMDFINQRMEGRKKND